MNIRRRLEELEKQKGRDADYCVLSGPRNANPAEVLERWMLETGNPSPRLFIYVRKFSDASEIVIPTAEAPGPVTA
ncbi:MAG: hypothetical protein ACRESZ_14500 [Methylococcales bacterium]